MALEVKRTLEREIKLSPGGSGFRLPDLPGEPLAERTLVSTYHDTPDHRLSKAGVTLRRRLEDGHGRWQLKLPAGEARLELEVDGPAQSPPEELLDLVVAYARGAELEPVATLETRRAGVTVTDGGRRIAEVVLDRVAVMTDGAETWTFDELEVELLDGGGNRDLRRLERALRRAGAADGDRRPKVFQALGLDDPRPPAGEPEPGSPIEHLAAMLRAQRRAILANDPGTRVGDDPEHLHDFRVAVRRLRALLRAGRPLLDRAWADSVRAQLRWLGHALGPVRDLDVLTAMLRSDAAGFAGEDRAGADELLAVLGEERALRRAELLEALRGHRYVALLDLLDAAVASPRASGAGVSLEDIAAAELRRLRREVRRLPEEPSDEHLHAVRIDAKRARYAAELAAAGAHPRRAAAFVKAAKQLQDVLGEHQDAHVADARLRALAADATPAGALAAGRLIELQAARRLRMRDAFPAAWKALDKSGERWLDAAA